MRLIDWLFLAMPLWVGTRHALRFAPAPAAPAPGGGGPAVGDGLLLENGTDFLLLESGDFLLLE